MYNFMFTGWVYKNVSFSTKNTPKWLHANLSTVTKNTEEKLTEQFLLFVLYNHRKIKPSNFFVSFEVTKCGHCLCQLTFLKHLCSYHKSLDIKWEVSVTEEGG